MNSYGKKLTGVALVAALSSGLTMGAFGLFNSSSHAGMHDQPLDSTYAHPTQFTPVAVHSAFETDFTIAAEHTVNAVVNIIASSTPQQSHRGNGGFSDPFFEYFFGDGNRNVQPRAQMSQGSGVIITPDGYIVTNNHVVEGADKVEVTMNDNRSFNGRIIGTDPSTDLALVKIEASDLPTVKFGDSDKLKVGEWVLAVGNPMGLNSTVTAGIVSAKARNLGMISRNQKLGIESFIQTDAVVNPGNSGGALVNTAGELVGINTAIFSSTGQYIGYSFAVPTTIVSKVIADLKEYGTVQRAVLGIGYIELTPDLVREKSLNVQEGVYVGEIYNRSSAMEAGIQEGDVIIAINGVKIKNGAMLTEQLAQYRPGDKIKVELVRGNDNKTVSLTLKNSQGSTEITKITGMSSLGAGFKELNTNELKDLNIRYGVKVTGLQDGKFKSAGIRNGFVILEINNTPVKSISALENIYDSIVKSNNAQKVMFITGIYPSGKMMYYAIDLAD